jgi:ribosomal protein S18 acetylase RimI-like enzyme
MIDIRPLSHFDPARFQDIASGYTTMEIYRVERSESDEWTTFILALESLPTAQEYRFLYSHDDLDRYRDLVNGDFCLGAFEGQLMVGVALAEPHEWNRTLWVWEFHVASTHRRLGVGRRLMGALSDQARSLGLRALVCETQNTNVPAIRFYRSVGYRLEGIDVSYYTNEDMQPGRTVAAFMKLRLE